MATVSPSGQAISPSDSSSGLTQALKFSISCQFRHPKYMIAAKSSDYKNFQLSALYVTSET
jgi:hypothetical protein